MQQSALGKPPDDGLFCFAACGLRIISDIWLPPLVRRPPPIEQHDAASDVLCAVTLRRGPVPARLEALRAERALWQLSDDEALLSLAGLGRLHLQRGVRITYDLQATADPYDLAAFLWGAVLPVLLAQRGQVCLRGTALRGPDGALLLLGESGAGKTTLAARLLARGMTLISDGVVVLEEHPSGGWQVLPGLPALRRWPDRSLGETLCPTEASPVRRGVGCTWRACETVTAPVPLHEVVRIVAEAPSLGAPVAGLTGMRAYEALAASLFSNAVVLPAHLKRSFSVLSELVRCVPVRRVDRVERDVEATLEHLTVATGTALCGVTTHRVSRVATRSVAMSSAGHIWLASYPKSGNTWMRALLSSLLDPERQLDINHLIGGGVINTRSGLDAWSGVESAVLTAAELEALHARYALSLASHVATQRFVKVHNACTQGLGSGSLFPPSSTAGVVYIVRNPLDVAISFAHHRGKDIDRTIADMADEACTLASQRQALHVQLPQRLLTWSQHVASWLDSGLPLVLVRYEDLLTDAVSALEKVCALAGLDVLPAHLAAAVESASFARLQAQERAQGFQELGPGGGAFFRQGRAGGWREVLSDEQVARILAAHGPMMSRLGYLPV